MYNSSLNDIIHFGKAFDSLGTMVQDQVTDLAEGNGDKCNPNAVRLIKERLGGLNAELDAVIANYLDEQGY